MLQEPIDVEQDPNQTEMALGEKDYSKYLTGVQRAELKIRITAAFEKQAEKNADDVEPPDFSDSRQGVHAGELGIEHGQQRKIRVGEVQHLDHQ